MGKVKVGIKILNEKRSKEKVRKDDRKELQSILPLAETTRITILNQNPSFHDGEIYTSLAISSRDDDV